MSTQNNTCAPRLRFPGFTGEWEERLLGDSFEERNEKNRGDLPLLSLGEAGLVYQSETARKDNSNEDKSKYLRVAIGDIAYNTMRMWQGRCVYAGIEGIVSPAYTVCKPKEGIDPLFHFYLFKTNRMTQIFHQHSQGLVKDTLNLKFEAFAKIKYLVPSLAEQKKIAECLADMDNLIAAQSENVDALKEKKKGLMQQLFPQNGETTPRLRFPGFDGEWEEKKLGDICSVNRGVRVTRKDLTDDGLYPVFQNTDRPLGFYNLSNVEPNNPFVIIGGSAGLIGYCKTKFWAADDCAYFGDADILDKYFLYCTLLLHSAEIKDNVRGGNIPRLERASLERIIMHLPSLVEQQKIAECLSALDDQISAESAKLEALKDHKKGLMQQLFPQPAN